MLPNGSSFANMVTYATLGATTTAPPDNILIPTLYVIFGSGVLSLTTVNVQLLDLDLSANVVPLEVSIKSVTFVAFRI